LSAAREKLIRPLFRHGPAEPIYLSGKARMTVSMVFLIASLLLILASCYVFVNAVECLGNAFNLHQGIVGSILAAIGTALPETIIPVLAIMFSKRASSHDVGIGAIAGAPFMLSTLAFFVTGAAVLIYSALGKRSRTMNVNTGIISKDLTFFLIIYGTAVGTTLFHEIIWLKILIALLLLLSYLLYLKLIVSDQADLLENVEPLYVKRYFKVSENVPWISLQLVFGLILMLAGAHFFIHYIQALSLTLGIAPLILSLIITPIATELPEKLNSVIWVGRNKETLAIGNLTGAMVFQSCFPVVFGMIFTPWNLQGITLVSAALALIGAAINLVWLKVFKRMNPTVLMLGGILYLIFLCFVFF
jgi:cation:H+ antiporter